MINSPPPPGHLNRRRRAAAHTLPDHHRGRTVSLHAITRRVQEQEIPRGSASLCEEVDDLQRAVDSATGQSAGDCGQVISNTEHASTVRFFSLL